MQELDRIFKLYLLNNIWFLQYKSIFFKIFLCAISYEYIQLSSTLHEAHSINLLGKHIY